jgi:hypothetical protein
VSCRCSVLISRPHSFNCHSFFFHSTPPKSRCNYRKFYPYSTVKRLVLFENRSINKSNHRPGHRLWSARVTLCNTEFNMKHVLIIRSVSVFFNKGIMMKFSSIFLFDRRIGKSSQFWQNDRGLRSNDRPFRIGFYGKAARASITLRWADLCSPDLRQGLVFASAWLTSTYKGVLGLLLCSNFLHTGDFDHQMTARSLKISTVIF